jgi:hypothetical protein
VLELEDAQGQDPVQRRVPDQPVTTRAQQRLVLGAGALPFSQANRDSISVKMSTTDVRSLYSRRNLIEHHVYHYRIAPETSVSSRPSLTSRLPRQ